MGQQKGKTSKANGEGHIRQLPDNRWEARIMNGYNEKGKPKYKTFEGKTKAIVVKRLAAFIADRKSLEAEVVCKDTVKEWLEKWYKNYVVDGVKVKTRESYEYIMNHHLIPHLGHIKLRDLKKVDIERMYDSLLKDGRVRGKGGLSIKTVQTIALALHRALEVALENEYINKNPAAIAKVPTMKSTNTEKTEIEVFTKEEQKTLLSACERSGTHGIVVYTALFTGLRMGELLGLQWDDIDFENNTISICRQVGRVRDYSPNAPAKTKLGIQNDTKTKASSRKISMPDQLAERLKKYKRIQDVERQKWGKVHRDMDMVFAREDGSFIDPGTLRDKYYGILGEKKIDRRTFHALRHTFATRALEAGVAIKVVSNILGHAGVQITLDTYSHVLPEFQSTEMNQIASYIVG